MTIPAKDWLRVLIPFAVYGFLGWMAGQKLAGHPGLVEYKLFNVIGYAMALLGMVVLSQLVVESERYRTFILEHFSQHVIAFLIASGGALMLYGFHWSSGPSAKVVEALGVKVFFSFVMPSMLVFSIGIHGTESPVPWSDKTRLTVFGAYLAGGGMLLQFYAAICDLFA